MAERRIRMIVSDIDDTLLTSDHRILPEVAQAVAHAQAAGILFTLATGRAFPIVEPIANALRLRAPVVTNNGAVVRSGDKVHGRWPLPGECLDELADRARQLHLTAIWFTDEGGYAATEDDGTRYYMSIGGVPLTYVGDLPAWRRRTIPNGAGPAVVNALMAGTEDQVALLLPRLQAEYAGRLQISRSKPRLIEVTAHGVSKRRALEVLAAEYGITRDEIMAIGDSLNDLEMLAWAGVGVAVANAPAEVKAAADIVVPSNDEGGVAAAVEMCLRWCGADAP